MFFGQSGDTQLTREEEKELLALVERIIDSGALGKSKIYTRILRYLAECRIATTPPKETAIAIDVLEKDADFDISRDSSVRAYMYQLRSKLNDYFLNAGADERYHIVIPKGQYGLTVVPRRGLEEEMLRSAMAASAARKPVAAWLAWPRVSVLVALLACTVAALALLSVDLRNPPEQAAEVAERPAEPAVADPLAAFGFWGNIFDDDRPVLILVGDYYTFVEHASDGHTARVVRDLDVNSREDFDRLLGTRPELHSRYSSTNMSYIPMGTADALATLTPFLDRRSRQVQVKMMSQSTTADLVDNHIIYLGLLSGLGQLHDLMFASSDLYIGATYDELYTIDTDMHYVSNYSVSGADDSFRDYGVLSAFTAPRGNQFIMLAGMRDAGLVNLVEQAISPTRLQALSHALQTPPAQMREFEALYEVVGMHNTNFDARLLHSQLLDSRIIWETKLASTLSGPE
ncbi:MAG TPA: hypothetical protein VNR18_12865 [Hyphomicrobiales bacterium]|nr:hypothetical protein [Hyphomicrobiales bacterium]